MHLNMTISIIIPVYNVAQYLNECLDSVVRADSMCRSIDGAGVEMICIDDGSTDDSAKILDDFAAKHGRCHEIHVIHKQNGGVSSARNLAIGNAKGDWIVFLDADDMLTEKSLLNIFKMAQGYPEAELLRYRIVDFKDGCTPPIYGCDIKNIVICDCRQKIVDGWLGDSFVTYVYRRDIIGSIRFKEYRLGEDRLFLGEVLSRASKKVEADFVGYLCRARKGSATHSSITANSLVDSICWKMDFLDYFYRSGIKIGVGPRRKIVIAFLEANACDILSLPEGDWNTAWAFWLKAVTKIPLEMTTSAWQRFVISVLSMTGSKILAMVFCVLPHRLKLCGFHR